MLWLKAFHIISIVAWFAGLFYLPRLFVYHSTSDDLISIERFKIMERRLYYAIMLPAAVAAFITGVGMILAQGWEAYYNDYWFSVKLILVLILVGYHVHCALLIKAFKHDRNRYSERWYRWFNEIPTLLLVAIVVLAVVRPF